MNIDKFQEKIGLTVGAVTTVIGSFDFNKIAVILGIIATITSIIIMLRKDKREKEEHEARMFELFGRRKPENQSLSYDGEKKRKTDFDAL